VMWLGVSHASLHVVGHVVAHVALVRAHAKWTARACKLHNFPGLTAKFVVIFREYFAKFLISLLYELYLYAYVCRCPIPREFRRASHVSCDHQNPNQSSHKKSYIIVFMEKKKSRYFFLSGKSIDVT
jgi:hypothetical protein